MKVIIVHSNDCSDKLNAKAIRRAYGPSAVIRDRNSFLAEVGTYTKDTVIIMLMSADLFYTIDTLSPPLDYYYGLLKEVTKEMKTLWVHLRPTLAENKPSILAWDNCFAKKRRQIGRHPAARYLVSLIKKAL